MLIGAPIQDRPLRFSDRLQTYSERLQRILPGAFGRSSQSDMAVSEPETKRKAENRTDHMPVEEFGTSEYPALPARAFEWLSLEELTAEARQLGMLTSEEWDGTKHIMTILGQRYAFTPKQARAFLFGAIEGQRVYAHRERKDDVDVSSDEWDS